MALETNQLFSGVQRGPSIRMAAEHAAPKTLAAVALAPLYKVGTPMYFNGTAWVVWTNTQIVEAFVYFQTEVAGATVVTPNVNPALGTVAEGIQTHATDEVLGVLMLTGRIHYGDIVLPAGEMQANLDAALKNGLVKAGLIVQGLINTR